MQALLAVAHFRCGQYADAINAFLELNINPAKVVALYPDTVSGRLSAPEEEWIHLYGGPVPEVPTSTSSNGDPEETKAPDTESGQSDQSQPARPPSPQGSVRGLLRSGLDSLKLAAKKDDELETASMRTKRKEGEY